MKRTYTVAREGFLMNNYKMVGDAVFLHERQAAYLIHSGQLTDPNAKPSVNAVAAAIFADDKNAPGPAPEHDAAMPAPEPEAHETESPPV